MHPEYDHLMEDAGSPRPAAQPRVILEMDHEEALALLDELATANGPASRAARSALARLLLEQGVAVAEVPVES